MLGNIAFVSNNDLIENFNIHLLYLVCKRLVISGSGVKLIA